jgi:hypothetical protein
MAPLATGTNSMRMKKKSTSLTEGKYEEKHGK